MKRFIVLILVLLMSVSVIACKNGGSTPPQYAISVSDISVEQNTEHIIEYTLTPAGTSATIVYEIVSSSPSGCIRISDGVIYADEVGTATVKARARNLTGAAETFNVSDDFTVTVTSAPDPYGDELIKNGGFEHGYDRWTVAPADPTYIYKITINNAKSHSGDAALNLWYNPIENASKSVALDLKVSQENINVTEGTYLLSFWYQGEITDITANVYDQGSSEPLKSKVFAGYGYTAMAVHNAYVNYGMEITFDQAKEIKVELQMTGEEGCWGYLDDVSFEPGTEEDLIVAPKGGEAGEYNFILNSKFSSNTNGWVITKPSTASFERVSSGGGYLGAWNIADNNELSAYYPVQGLPAREYNACVYFVGGAGAFKSTKLVVKNSTGVLYSQDFVTIGWNGGVYIRAEIVGMSLSGDIEVGVEIVGSPDANWINFNNFALWSVGYDHTASTDTGLTNIKIDGVDVVSLEVELGYYRFEALVAAKANVLSFVEGTPAAGASITAAVFDDTTGELSITVTAEDGTTTHAHIITVTRGQAPAEPEWVDVALINPGFETSYKPEGWSYTNFKDEWIVSDSSKHNGTKGIKGSGKVAAEGSPSTLTQSVAGFALGDKIKVSVWVATYYGDKVTSVKLLAGGQSEEMSDMATTSGWQKISAEFTLTEADIAAGSVTIGIEFTQATGGWINIDDFTLEIWM